MHHASDVFSLACLLWELTVGMQASDGTATPLLQGRDGRVSTHRYKLSQLNPDKSLCQTGQIPGSLRQTLHAMLQLDRGVDYNMKQVCECPFLIAAASKS